MCTGGGSSGSSGGNDALWNTQAQKINQDMAMSGELFDYWKKYSPGYLANANAMTQEAMDGTLTNRMRSTAGADADQATDSGEDSPEETDEGRLEDLVDAIRALEGDRTGRAFVLVHRHLTSQGRELSPTMADTLVRDALGRSGWTVLDEVPDELGKVLECEPRRPKP